MVIVESIVKILSSVMSFFVVRYGDSIATKWAVYVSIAWETAATKNVRENVAKRKIDFLAASSDKFKEWEKWRKARISELDKQGAGKS